MHMTLEEIIDRLQYAYDRAELAKMSGDGSNDYQSAYARLSIHTESLLIDLRAQVRKAAP